MKNIFIDMDGVLAEYRIDCTEELLAQQGYFANLKPLENMLDALNILVQNARKNGYKVCVLTKVYPTMFKYSVEEKQEWRAKYMPYLCDNEFVIVDGEKEEKSEAIRNNLGIDIDENCVLIDDYNYNLYDWQTNGGTPIKFVNPINDKRKSFKGNRISYSMSPIEIVSALTNAVA